MQGMSFGPADLAASRRMKTTRVGGGHPGYRVLSDPGPRGPRRAARRAPSRTSGTTRSGAWSTPAPPTGILPFYGPFGDIRDLDGCEAQFRAAFLMGCVGAWSLHPAQIDVAKKVFSPDPDEVIFARKVIEAIPDGRGVHMIDGKMQDDATWKQCRVMVDLAEMLAAKDPELAEAYGIGIPGTRLNMSLPIAPPEVASARRLGERACVVDAGGQFTVARQVDDLAAHAAVGGAREFVFDLGGVRRYETQALTELSACAGG